MAPRSAAITEFLPGSMVRGKSAALPGTVERVSAPAERCRPKYVADFLDPDLPIRFCGRLDQRPSPFRRRIRHLAFIAPGRDRLCGRLPPRVLEGPQHSSSSDISSGNVRLIRLFCGDRKSTRLNSSHANISYAVFCLKKKK